MLLIDGYQVFLECSYVTKLRFLTEHMYSTNCRFVNTKSCEMYVVSGSDAFVINITNFNKSVSSTINSHFEILLSAAI